MLRTPDGWKAVEDFRPGDEIVSRPEGDSGAANTVRKVVRLLTRSGHLMTLHVNGREIGTTHEHPWWVVGRGWVTANALAAGDVFLTSEHAEVVLERIEDADRYASVYNLEVEADHTYFVGDAGWGFDVWSHNHHRDASVQRTKQGGKFTEPILPEKTIVSQKGVTIEHYTRSGDHGPPHLHVKGGGPETKIGSNGKPIEGSPELTPHQSRIVNANKQDIEKALDKIGRWWRFETRY